VFKTAAPLGSPIDKGYIEKSGPCTGAVGLYWVCIGYVLGMHWVRADDVKYRPSTRADPLQICMQGAVLKRHVSFVYSLRCLFLSLEF
jgi:hypothetical protein